MDRKQFIKTCTFGCLTGLAALTALQSCSSTKVLNKEITGSDILVPISDFEIKNNSGTSFKKYLVVQNNNLQFPICIYRFDAVTFTALLMECPHQGAELQVFGDKLQCAAHGSEFSNKGAVESGPADTALRQFPITIVNNTLKISLK
jgi:Rieske Fe-S protein